MSRKKDGTDDASEDARKAADERRGDAAGDETPRAGDPADADGREDAPRATDDDDGAPRSADDENASRPADEGGPLTDDELSDRPAQEDDRPEDAPATLGEVVEEDAARREAEEAARAEEEEERAAEPEPLPHEPHPHYDEEHYEEPRPGLAARALQAVAILLVGGGLALWLAPKAAPYLPASVSKYMVVAVPVEVSEFEARAQEVNARLQGLENAVQSAQEAAAQAQAAAEAAGAGTDAQAEARAEALAPIRAAIEELRAAVEENDTTQLAARVNSLENTAQGLQAEFSALSEGLDSIGSETGELSEVAADTVARIAARAAEIDGLKAQIDELSRQIGATQQTAEEAAAAAQARIDEAEAAFEARLQEEADKTAAVEADMASAQNDSRLQLARDRVSAALETGRPYAAALDNVADLAPAPEALAATAEDGVATLEDLTARFKPAAQEAITAARLAEAGDTPTSRALARFTAQFTGIPVDGAEGDGVDAVLGRAWTALQDGDLDAALAETEALPQAAADAMSGWLEDARARAAARAAYAEWAGEPAEG